MQLRAPQVLRLCERHQLHTASAHIHTMLHDYRRPLLDMLAAVAMPRHVAAAAAAAAAAGGAADASGAAGVGRHSGDGSDAVTKDWRRERREAGLKLLVYLRSGSC